VKRGHEWFVQPVTRWEAVVRRKVDHEVFAEFSPLFGSRSTTSTSTMSPRGPSQILVVVALAFILSACHSSAKTEKKGEGGGKGGVLKAKLLAEEGAAALQKQDLATAMDKYI
jgi:hypothetical protein